MINKSNKKTITYLKNSLCWFSCTSLDSSLDSSLYWSLCRSLQWSLYSSLYSSLVISIRRKLENNT